MSSLAALPEKSHAHADRFIPVPVEAIPIDVPLAYPIYVRIEENFILLRPEGEKLTKQRVELLPLGLRHTVYLPKSSWVAFLGNLDKWTSQCKDLGSRSLGLRHLLYAHLRDAEEKKELSVKAFKDLYELSSELAACVGKLQSSSRLLRFFGDPALYFSNHCINVALAGFLYGPTIGIADPQRCFLSLLFHNMGNLMISNEILYKPFPLVAEEWRAIRTHPIHGGELLKNVGASTEIQTIAIQHHERTDGSGYPAGLVSASIHPLARLCAGLDVYFALRSPRPHEGAHSQPAARSILISLRHKLDPKVIDVILGGDF